MSAEHLKIFRAGACTNSQCKGVVKLVNDEVKVDSFFPVNIRVSNRQLATVSPINLYLCLKITESNIELKYISRNNLFMQYKTKKDLLIYPFN